MKKIIPLYAGLLVFYAIVMLVFILAGSHGKIILYNDETLKYLSIAITFILTAIVSLSVRKNVKNIWVKTLMIVLNAITVGLLFYQMQLLYPERFTILSAFILSLHLLGLILAVLIILTALIVKRNLS